jgi:GAF domain-containing protein
VTLSLKGANSPTRGRKLRSTGTKARARVSNGPNSLPPALADFLRHREASHTIDQAAEPVQVPSAKLAGARSHISVPMLKEGNIVGAIAIYRQEVRPFTQKQIELVTNFAAHVQRAGLR